MLTIGICDDRPLCRRLWESFLRLYEKEKGLFFHVHQFDSGERLLEEIDRQGMVFDLLFLDNSMKKLTGLETARQIRQSAAMAGCSIVFVTSAEDHDQFMPVQPLQVVSKPATQECIGEILDKVLAQKDCAQASPS
ncbi:response regulator receiver [Syntrophobotulus glycolicus DSM 8271]|uniref:Stage 0 sporulation protein A homolog n=1 Tax=Syntrophobotulus glycolicus (strain DSM 8271 / FlGlyR) TaxID=645991 RepID=F0SUM9_SYNGF|nr:response regulator [Syntrophobotulus glycolicus]ADY55522.1 response regulator receiver [Syntrophobotulus glycolicus DSM 8271]